MQKQRVEALQELPYAGKQLKKGAEVEMSLRDARVLSTLGKVRCIAAPVRVPDVGMNRALVAVSPGHTRPRGPSGRYARADVRTSDE